MKRSMILAAVALLLSGWSATADVTAPLREVVDEVCSRNALASSAVGLLAVTADGDTLVAVNPELKLVPASNVKLLTTGLALKALGPDFRFETRLGYTGELRGGVLHGDLYIVGGGDPTTGSRSTVAEPLSSLFGDWLTLLRKAGIERVEGLLVGDPASSIRRRPRTSAGLRRPGHQLRSRPHGAQLLRERPEFPYNPPAPRPEPSRT